MRNEQAARAVRTGALIGDLLLPVEIAEAGWQRLLEDIAKRLEPPAERKQDRSKYTEQRILKASLRIFARDGVSRSRIADIAAEAGVSTSTLYDYYRGKEELAYDIPRAYLSIFFQRYLKKLPGRHSSRERLSLYLHMLADFARENAEWARLFYLEIWPSVYVVQTAIGNTANLFAKVVIYLVQQCIDEDEISSRRSVHETSAMILGAINQVIITWLLYSRPKNLTKGGAEIADRILDMVAAERERENRGM